MAWSENPKTGVIGMRFGFRQNGRHRTPDSHRGTAVRWLAYAAELRRQGHKQGARLDPLSAATWRREAVPLP